MNCRRHNQEAERTDRAKESPADNGTVNGPSAWCFQQGRREIGIKFYQTTNNPNRYCALSGHNTAAVDHTTKRWQSPEIPPKRSEFCTKSTPKQWALLIHQANYNNNMPVIRKYSRSPKFCTETRDRIRGSRLTKPPDPQSNPPDGQIPTKNNP